MELSNLKTVSDYFYYVTEYIVPEFTESFDHYYAGLIQELQHQISIENYRYKDSRAIPSKDSKIYISTTGKYPGVALEVMYNRKEEVIGYSFVLYKRDCVVNPIPEIPALIYNNEFVAWFSLPKGMSLEDVENTPLDVEIITSMVNYNGPFIIDVDQNYIYCDGKTLRSLSKEQYIESLKSNN